MYANRNLLATLLLSCCAPALAQLSPQLTPLAPSPEPSSIQVDVKLLLVPVVVRDAHGVIVQDLRKEDFKVYDQGKPWAIKDFSTQRSSSSNNGAPPPLPLSTNAVAQAPSANRFTVYLFDDRHLSASDLAQVQTSIAPALAQPLGNNSRALVLSFHGVNSGITTDPAVLKAALLKLKPAPLPLNSHECPDVDYYQADQIANRDSQPEYKIAFEKATVCGHYSERTLNSKTSSQEIDQAVRSAVTRTLQVGDLDARETLTGLLDVIYSMRKLPGQRNLVLVSPGFLSVSQEAMHLQSQILNMAASLNITINSLDARGVFNSGIEASESGAGSSYGLQTGQVQQDHGDSLRANNEAMADLAAGSGGRFIHNTNDLAGAFKSLAAGPECVYLLYLSLQNVKDNGNYHALKVEVAQKDVKVQARKGYFAPQPAKK